MPIRIQLRRLLGWRLPPGAIVVSRPSRFGNSYKIGHRRADPRTGELVTIADNAHAVELFRAYYELALARGSSSVRQRLDALRGHDLACWCRLDQACHADVLLELANPSAEAGAAKADA